MAETPPDVTIRRRLAIGGMGELFLGDQGGRTVVVKRLLPAADATHRDLFQREGDALAALDSPHIVSLLSRGPGYLVLDYVDGTDLGQLLAYRKRRGKAVPIAVGAAILGDLLRALDHLHRATDGGGTPLGLVHRDVHPGNILLDKTGRAVLADLGVVRTEATDQATTAGLKGTLAYMAPEQLHGRPAGPAADLYAAGLVAYEVLTGVPARPAGAIGLGELLAARDRLPTPPSAVRPGIPAALETSVMTALAPDPAARHASAAAWLRVLEASAPQPDRPAVAKLVAQVAASKPNTTVARTLDPTTLAAAPPESTPEAPRSRRWMLGLGVAGAGALAVGLGAGLWPSDDQIPRRALDSSADRIARRTPEPPPAVIPAADAIDPSDVLEAPASADSVIAATPDAAVTTRRRPVRRPNVPAATVATEAPMRLRVVPRGGPVHVSGPGAAGLAPQRLAALEPGRAQVIRLTGGEPPLKATLRITRTDDALSLSIGAAPGRVHTVTCGGNPSAQTPVRGIRVQASGLTCKIADPAGGTLSFLLAAGE